MDRLGHKPTYSLHQGFRIPMGFPLDCFVSAWDYPAQAGDTFIVTYPKCGTTWTQNIVWMLHHDGVPFPVGKEINREVPHLEEVGSEFVVNFPLPRFIKTHLSYDLTPQHPEAKYLYIARNPFDCAVSFYYHTQGFVKHYDFAEGTFADFFECFIRGEVDWGDYFDHLIPWYGHRDDQNVLFLTYEQMLVDPRWAVSTIATFLGKGYSERVTQKEMLQQVLDHTSFSKMSQDQSRWSSQRPDCFTPFIRKGTVGDWRNHFSQAQTLRLVEKFKARSQGTDLARLWPGLGEVLGSGDKP